MPVDINSKSCIAYAILNNSTLPALSYAGWQYDSSNKTAVYRRPLSIGQYFRTLDVEIPEMADDIEGLAQYVYKKYRIQIWEMLQGVATLDVVTSALGRSYQELNIVRLGNGKYMPGLITESRSSFFTGSAITPIATYLSELYRGMGPVFTVKTDSLLEEVNRIAPPMDIVCVLEQNIKKHPEVFH